jgi:hypothetical protein
MGRPDALDASLGRGGDLGEGVGGRTTETGQEPPPEMDPGG